MSEPGAPTPSEEGSRRGPSAGWSRLPEHEVGAADGRTRGPADEVAPARGGSSADATRAPATPRSDWTNPPHRPYPPHRGLLPNAQAPSNGQPIGPAPGDHQAHSPAPGGGQAYGTVPGGGQAPSQQAYGQPPWAGAGHRTRGTNGFAIAALVCGLLPLIPLALIFGVVALGQVAERRQDGRWHAIVGMVAAGVWTAGLVLGGSPAEFLRDDGERASWADRADGECVDGLSGLEADDQPTPGDLPAVPCTGPHEGEIYAVFQIGDETDAYPGQAAASRETDRRCQEQLRTNPPRTVSTNAIVGYIYVFPLEHGWPEQRTAVCVAYDPQDVTVPGVAPIPGV